MPVINGQVCRSRFTSLKLRELSGVDNPAQPGALALIMKRHDQAAQIGELAGLLQTAKYIGDDAGAHTFSEVLADAKFGQEIWPYTDALTQSIRSIVGDKSLSGGERETKINASVGEFLAAVRSISPEVEKRLSGLIIRKEQDMPKSVEELEKEIGTLKGQLATAEQARDDAIKAKDAAETKMKEEEDAHKATKAKLVEATDETIKVGDQEIKKSEVGDASFNLAKTLAGERQTAQLEKRAATDFAHVPGTDAEKALVLKSIDGLAEDNPTRKAIEAVMTAAEKMAKAGFQRLGSGGGLSGEGDANKAEADFMGKVAEIEKRDNCARHVALSKARQEHPELFAAYNGGGEAAAN